MISKQFWKNVLPSMIAFAFSGIYAIVDGIFVGQNVGDAGLAAINIAYPLTALIQASGAGIGMAGAIWLAICIGKQDKESEKVYLGNTCVLLAISGVILTVFLSLFHASILKLFGADGKILEYAVSYIRIIAFGSVFQILATGLIPMIRNYNGAVTAMFAMIAGFVTNVILDWLFVSVYSFGTAGAALATVIGQGITILPCLAFLVIKKKCHNYAVYRLHKKAVKELLATAVSPFGLTLSPNIMIVILNKGAIVYGNEVAVACYAIISYVICVVQLLLQGIGDGCQPLIGRYYGANDIPALKKVGTLAFRFAPAVALCSVAALYAARNLIPRLFGASEQAAYLFANVLPYFILGLLFLSFSRITTSYFYATQKNTLAYILIYGEPLILFFLVSFVLPPLFQLNGLWMSVPVTQFLVAAAGFIFIRISPLHAVPKTVKKNRPQTENQMGL